MSISIACDLCGKSTGFTEPCNVFRMWTGVMCGWIEQSGLSSQPFDENFYVCAECMEKVCDFVVKLKVVEQ